jgi:molybdate transport system substrate-binding protein
MTTVLCLLMMLVPTLSAREPGAVVAAGDTPRVEPLRVGAAISLGAALGEITASTSAVELTLGSSGQLANQLRGGAPIDVIVSASRHQIEPLLAQGLLKPESLTVIAGNRLVVIVPKESTTALFHLSGLANLSRIAVGEPMSVPAGRYAAQALAHQRMDLGKNLVFGLNAKQILDYVARGEVDAGVVYLSDVDDRVKIALHIDPATHDAIEYVAAISSRSTHPHADLFVRSLTDAGPQEILERHRLQPRPTAEQQPAPDPDPLPAPAGAR